LLAVIASIQLALRRLCQGVDRQLTKPLACTAQWRSLQIGGQGTFAGTQGNGELAPKAAIPARLFDDLIRFRQYPRRHRQAKGVRRFEVDKQLEFHRLLDGYARRVVT
jgi:hypothetical protein